MSIAKAKKSKSPKKQKGSDNLVPLKADGNYPYNWGSEAAVKLNIVLMWFCYFFCFISNQLLIAARQQQPPIDLRTAANHQSDDCNQLFAGINQQSTSYRVLSQPWWLVFQETFNSIVSFDAPKGIWDHEKIIHKRMPQAEVFSPHQLLTRSMKYFGQGFIPLGKRKTAPVEQGRFESIDTIHMDVHGKQEYFVTTGSLGAS